MRELKFVIDLRQTTKPVGQGSDAGSGSSHSGSDRSLKSAISKETIKHSESSTKLDSV